MSAVVICAHNEGPRIGAVLLAATGARSTSEVVVVADACTDDTAQVARSFGAHVIEITSGDKGTAMATGIAAVGDRTVLFLDADLCGLLPGHIDALAGAEPAGGMVVGLRDGSIPSGLPPISGERRLPTAFAQGMNLAGLGYRVELAIDAAVARAGIGHRHYAMAGVTNPTRQARHPLMYADLAFFALLHLPSLALYTEQSIRGGAN